MEPLLNDFRVLNAEIASLHNATDIELLQSCRIIAMTTTGTCASHSSLTVALSGAARMHSVLKHVKPQVVMVEEAAEVLESHILAALHPTVEQLILSAR